LTEEVKTYDIVEPEFIKVKSPTPEPTPQKTPEVQPEQEIPKRINFKSKEKKVDGFNIIPQKTSLNNLDMDSEQKNVFNFMNDHPFEDTPKAPEVDIEMVRNLGEAKSKTKIDENRWKVTYSNGAQYEGDIINDSGNQNYEQPISFGKFRFPNGDTYEGTIGVRAKGTYTHSNGVVYEGQFYKANKSGNGKETFPSGAEYIGKFKNNLYDGKGKMNFTNGDSYVGNFNEGKREHIGTYNFPSGEKVEGDWHDDMLHGHGEYNFSDGSKVRSAFESSQIKL
jgi:hypothetical protein